MYRRHFATLALGTLGAMPVVRTALAGDDTPAASPAVRRAPRSTIPTLLISGSFDAVTSLDWAEAAARSLPNSTIISIPGAGHYVAPQSPCAQTVIASFLSDPNAPDTSCVGTLAPPSFTSRASP
jgi:pimeloyl-ACP methyl ester carboxylesterase